MAQAAINGIHIHYVTYGPPTGMPVMLLHAFPLRGAMWQAQAELLATELDCHVIVPDLRGFGDSEATVPPVLMETMADDVLALADHLGHERFVLGGLSMGGYISLALLRMASWRIRALILADTKASTDTPAGRHNREELAQLAEQHGVRAVADTMLPRLLSSATIEQRPDIVAEVREMIESNSVIGIAAASRGMALRTDTSELLATVECPVQLLVGSLDAVVSIAEMQSMFQLLPEAQLEIISGAGHLSNLESSEQFGSALVHFLRGISVDAE